MSDFPHWPVLPVGEVFYVKGRIGWRNLRRSDFCDEGPYLITGMHIRDSGAIDWDACFHIPRRKYEESPEIKVCVGDLIITKDGTIGKIGRVDWMPGETSLNSHLFLVRPYRPEQCLSQFAFHVFTSPAFRRFIENQKSGSTLAGLGEAKFIKFQFPTPSAGEQSVVGGLLDTIDTAIHETEAIIAKLKAVRQGLLHDLLTRGIDANGELRPTQAEAPRLYKQSPLGWIPKDWETESVAKACSDVVDCPHSTPQFLDQGVLVARTMHIKDGLFLEGLASRVSERQYRERIARLEPQAGDVIFTREAPVGEAFVIPSGMKICLGQRVMLLRPKDGRMTGEYLLAQIRSGSVKDRIATLTSGTTNPHLNVSEIRDFDIPLPRLVEQQGIGERLRGLESRLQFETREQRKLERLKSGLMDDLLTGRVRVNPLQEGTAS